MLSLTIVFFISSCENGSHSTVAIEDCKSESKVLGKYLDESIGSVINLYTQNPDVIDAIKPNNIEKITAYRSFYENCVFEATLINVKKNKKNDMPQIYSTISRNLFKIQSNIKTIKEYKSDKKYEGMVNVLFKQMEKDYKEIKDAIRANQSFQPTADAAG